jgi:2-polyprenyl-3-methyl-5-hydroxy-6-metoxy-1,4-benzoquinol methylase
MKKPLDRITEAYFGELGEVFADKVRNRIHWICENAVGESILDVGCSQGITSILLGREGKSVIGIDLLEESIEYANNLLSTEEEITKRFVQFKAANFMDVALEKQSFDSVIFGEILEHITDPKRFIKMAMNMLNPNGSIIITLPFGINDYFDHKKTYYMMDLLNFTDENAVIQEIKFFGKWVGAVLKKKGEENRTVSISSEIISRLEDAFYIVEKDLWQQIKNRGQKIKNFEEKIKLLSADIVKNKSLAIEQLEKKNNELNSLKNLFGENNKTIESLNAQIVLMEKEKVKTKESFQAHLNFMEQEQEKKISVLNVQFESLIKEQEEKINILIAKLDSKEKEKEEVINTFYTQISSKGEEQKEKEQEKKIISLNAQLKQKEELIVTLQQNQIKKNKQISDLENIVVISKKEKIKVQETLFGSYVKEENLLESYKRLLRKYQALSKSKLGKLTLSYWRKKRKVMGGK